jgi:hypothetical protein
MIHSWGYIAGQSTVLDSYPWENCPKLSLRLILVPGGSTISFLPSGMEIELSGIWTSSSGGLIGNVSSAMGARFEIDSAGCAGWGWLGRVETGETNDDSGGAGGAPYTGTGRWGDDCVTGMGGANSSMRGGLYGGGGGGAMTGASSNRMNWK